MIFRFPRVKQFPRIKKTGFKVINIRGTNGSGKTVIVRKLIDRFIFTSLKNSKKVWAYELSSKIFVLGRYETPTGGCDTIRTQDEVCRGVVELATQGHVIFEGLLISGMHSRFVNLARALPTHHFIFAILDTPLKKCIRRTIRRREERGATKPFNSHNLEAKYKAVQSSKLALEKAGMDVRMLDHKKAVTTILKWLGE